MALTRSTRSAVLLLLAAFVLGAAAGVAGAALFGPPDSGRPKKPDPERYLKRLDHDLSLSTVQEDSIRGILGAHKPVMDSAWAEWEARIETLRTEIRSEVSRQLTPDQKRKYDAMNQHTDSLRRQASQ